LAVTGTVQMPSAIENIIEPHVPWRGTGRGFGFGLLHDLAVAIARASLRPSSIDLLVSLLAFNPGVGGGQLRVIAGRLSAFDWYLHAPASLLRQWSGSRRYFLPTACARPSKGGLTVHECVSFEGSTPELST
jgi:hypothetical protein